MQTTTNPIPKPFRPSNDTEAVLQTDASDIGWGASLIVKGKEVGTCAQKWTDAEKMLDITHREALASALAVEHLMEHIPPGCRLKLETDAVSTAFAWKKGSKLPAMNGHIAPQVKALSNKGIYIEPRHIPGTTNKRADWLSRNPDPKNYRLNQDLFQAACRHFHIRPEVDLFASRHNRQCQKYGSWRADIKSLGNAFQLHWGKFIAWVNPPWELIPQVLKKIKEDRARALVCLPHWRAAPWWRTLLEIQTATPVTLRNTPLFADPEGNALPPPRWGTLFTTVQG
jgi:hypothetical protein